MPGPRRVSRYCWEPGPLEPRATDIRSHVKKQPEVPGVCIVKAMKPHRMRHVAGQIYDAALAPELWPAALGSVAACFGAVGAGYIVRNKRTGRVDWADLAGPITEMKTDFVERYAALDPY